MTQESTTMPAGRYFQGTGRRKTAVARVRLFTGSGAIEVNGKPYLETFTRVVHQRRIQQPLELAGMAETLNLQAKVAGGGVSAWADAIAHGTARALVRMEEALRPTLRKSGFLTRDPRVKERKKVGLKRARKAPQYTKR